MTVFIWVVFKNTNYLSFLLTDGLIMEIIMNYVTYLPLYIISKQENVKIIIHFIITPSETVNPHYKSFLSLKRRAIIKLFKPSSDAVSKIKMIDSTMFIPYLYRMPRLWIPKLNSKPQNLTSSVSLTKLLTQTDVTFSTRTFNFGFLLLA